MERERFIKKAIKLAVAGAMVVAASGTQIAKATEGTTKGESDPWVHFPPGHACFAVSDHNICTNGYYCQMPPVNAEGNQPVGSCQPVTKP